MNWKVKLKDLFHANCKEGEKPLNLNIIRGSNIGRHDPSSIMKTPSLDIRVLGEHGLYKILTTKSHSILRVLEIDLTKRNTCILHFIQAIKEVLETNLINQIEIISVEH